MKSNNNKVFINGFEYGWSNVKLLINNLPTIGITSINYAEENANEDIFGIGNQVIAYGIGNYTCTADITLYTSELIAIQKAARSAGIKDGSIQGLLPFDIIISYERPDNAGITTDILKNVMFVNNSRGMNQGDASFTTALTLKVSHIEWGVSV